MGKSTFNIIYVIQKGKAKADGSAPVVARITVNGEKSHFATRIYVDPACWLPKEYRTTGLTREERKVNEALDELRVLIKHQYDEMLRRSEVITAGKLKNAITGLDEKAMKLLDLCDQFIEDYKVAERFALLRQPTIRKDVELGGEMGHFAVDRDSCHNRHSAICFGFSLLNNKENGECTFHLFLFFSVQQLLPQHPNEAGAEIARKLCPARRVKPSGKGRVSLIAIKTNRYTINDINSDTENHSSDTNTDTNNSME